MKKETAHLRSYGLAKEKRGGAEEKRRWRITANSQIRKRRRHRRTVPFGCTPTASTISSTLATLAPSSKPRNRMHHFLLFTPLHLLLHSILCLSSFPSEIWLIKHNYAFYVKPFIIKSQQINWRLVEKREKEVFRHGSVHRRFFLTLEF